MATTPRAAAPDLAFLLAQAAHALTTELTARLAGLGVTPRSLCVLTHAMAGELTQGEVAELCALDKTTMVVTLDELESAGLAERRACPSDRRARIIAVTPEGERVAAAGKAVVEGVHAEVLASLPAGERAPFATALTRLVENRLSTPVACERPPRRRAPRAPASSRTG